MRMILLINRYFYLYPLRKKNKARAPSMNKNTTPFGTILSVLLQAACGFCIYKNYFLPAQILAVLSFYSVGPEVPKFTTWLQFVVWISSSILCGLSVEYGSAHFPLLSLSLFLCSVSVLLRLVFYTRFIHTQLLWFDASVFFLGCAGYVLANIFFPHSWQGWAMPVPVISFCLMLISNFIKEGNTYKRIHSAGYGVKVNLPAPDFSLPDQHGKDISLSGFRGKRHVLLLFIRGDWCPACHMMMRTYERSREKFMEKNVFLLAVGPDPVGVNRAMAERIGLDFAIVADGDHKVSTTYGVHVDKDPINNFLRPGYEEGLPLPASFLICDKGIVRYHSSPERVGEFLNPEFIFDVLKRI